MEQRPGTENGLLPPHQSACYLHRGVEAVIRIIKAEDRKQKILAPGSHAERWNSGKGARPSHAPTTYIGEEFDDSPP
jgi:hypothetical protein